MRCRCEIQAAAFDAEGSGEVDAALAAVRWPTSVAPTVWYCKEAAITSSQRRLIAVDQHDNGEIVKLLSPALDRPCPAGGRKLDRSPRAPICRGIARRSRCLIKVATGGPAQRLSTRPRRPCSFSFAIRRPTPAAVPWPGNRGARGPPRARSAKKSRYYRHGGSYQRRFRAKDATDSAPRLTGFSCRTLIGYKTRAQRWKFMRAS